MIYIGNKKTFRRHTLWGSFLGLEMSVGKAYHSDRYANLNSTSVIYRLDRPEDHPLTLDYFPSGLFLDRHKVQEKKDDGLDSDDEKEDHTSIPSWCASLIRKTYPNSHYSDLFGTVISNINSILSGTQHRHKVRVLSEYLALHKDKINQERIVPVIREGKRSLYNRNLFLPISLGGFGVKAPTGFNVNITKFDRLVAGFMIRRNSAHLSPYPLEGPALEKFLPLVAKPWLKPPEFLELSEVRIEKGHIYSCPRSFLKGPERIRSYPLIADSVGLFSHPRSIML